MVLSGLVEKKPATKILFRSESLVGDVVSTFTSKIGAIINLEVFIRNRQLKQFLIRSLCGRLSMLLDTDETLPMVGGCNFSNAEPNEYVAAYYLNPRYVGATHAVDTYNEHTLAHELEHIFLSRVEKVGIRCEPSPTFESNKNLLLYTST